MAAGSLQGFTWVVLVLLFGEHHTGSVSVNEEAGRQRAPRTTTLLCAMLYAYEPPGLNIHDTRTHETNQRMGGASGHLMGHLRRAAHDVDDPCRTAAPSRPTAASAPTLRAPMAHACDRNARVARRQGAPSEWVECGWVGE